MEMFYHPEFSGASEFMLMSEESRHLHAMRIRNGDVVLLTDGLGNIAECEISWKKNDAIAILKSMRSVEPRLNRLTIAVAPAKNMERNEWFVEKAVETGIEEIVFLQCKHSERVQVKKERIQKVAISALKQSESAWLPAFPGVLNFSDYIQSANSEVKCIAHCSEANQKRHLANVLKPGKSACILIGPEGDFSHDELEKAKALGFIEVSLGEKRLRTETAALFAVTAFEIVNSTQ